MEIDLPNQVKDTSDFRHAWNKLIQWCKRNTLYSSGDIVVNQTTYGTTLTLSPQIKQARTPVLPTQGSTSASPWKGEWNSASLYSVGDFVRVSTNPSSPAAGYNYTGFWGCNVVHSGSRPIYPEPAIYVSGSLQPANWSLLGLGVREFNTTNAAGTGSNKQFIGASDAYPNPY